MYVIIQSRWIRDSTQSGENIVWAGTRKKEALGQLKANIHSHFNMMQHHDYFGCDLVEVNLDIIDTDWSRDSLSEIVGADEFGVRYRMKYYMIEMPEDNKQLKEYLESR